VLDVFSVGFSIMGAANEGEDGPCSHQRRVICCFTPRCLDADVRPEFSVIRKNCGSIQ
jgi:hypothetical protein